MSLLDLRLLEQVRAEIEALATEIAKDLGEPGAGLVHQLGEIEKLLTAVTQR